MEEGILARRGTTAEGAYDNDFMPLPAGVYIARSKNVVFESKPWGELLRVDFVIASGRYEGRFVSEFLCVTHHEKKNAEEIAERNLRKLVFSIGKNDINAYEDLIGYDFALTLNQKPDKEGEVRNRISNYRPVNDKTIRESEKTESRNRGGGVPAAPRTPSVTDSVHKTESSRNPKAPWMNS